MMKTATTTAVQQKMSLNSDIQTIENIIGFAVIVIFVIIYNIAIIRFLFFGIRSLMKKTTDLPPSKRKWTRVIADFFEEDEKIYPRYYSFNKQEGKHEPLYRITYLYTVRYEYDGQLYETKFETDNIKKDKEVIYCHRKKPTILKEYNPGQPWTTEAAISVLFLAAFMIFMELVFISNT